MSDYEALRNMIRREIAAAMALRGRTKIGLVSTYDPGTYSARVLYQPENVLSGPLPIGTPRSGNAAGSFFAPNLGDQVLVEFLEGDRDSGVITLRLHSAVDAPLPVPAGEMWLAHESGSALKLHGDGTSGLNSQGDLSVTSPASVSIAAEGDTSVTPGGNLSLSAQGDGSLNVSGNLASSAASWAHDGDLGLQGTVAASDDVTADEGTISLVALAAEVGTIAGEVATISGNLSAVTSEVASLVTQVDALFATTTLTVTAAVTTLGTPAGLTWYVLVDNTYAGAIELDFLAGAANQVVVLIDASATATAHPITVKYVGATVDVINIAKSVIEFIWTGSGYIVGRGGG